MTRREWKGAVMHVKAVVVGTVGERIIVDGQELKALRKQLGLSLSKASRQVEVSVSTWCRWESGSQRIPEGAMKLFLLLNKDAMK